MEARADRHARRHHVWRHGSHRRHPLQLPRKGCRCGQQCKRELFQRGHCSTTQATSGDTIPPTDPTGLTATAVSSSQITLAWTASTDSGGSGLAGYRVERCQGAGCRIFVQIATPPRTAIPIRASRPAPATAIASAPSMAPAI